MRRREHTEYNELAFYGVPLVKTIFVTTTCLGTKISKLHAKHGLFGRVSISYK